MSYKILALEAENFKKLRAVEIRPDGSLVEITGKNGAGKTSVLEALWFALKGKKALPQKAVRKGAERMKVKADLGAFTVTRTLSAEEGAMPTLQIEMRRGATRDCTPQEFLDRLFDEFTADPTAFVAMATEQKIELLRRISAVTLDFDAIAAANKKDYDERTEINREVKQLQAQAAGMRVLDGLPREKMDEAAILARLNAAGEENRKAQAVFQQKQELGAAAARIVEEKGRCARAMDAQRDKIEMLEKALAEAKTQAGALQDEFDQIELKRIDAEQAFHAAPAGEPVDVTALTAELQNAQRTNRAIEERQQWDKLQERIEKRKRDADALTRQMEARDEKKRVTLSEAKIPVEGLTFDERRVLYHGLPLENLGEGEQIRLSTRVAMAANPELKVLCIRRGEALDEDGLKAIAEMAAEQDYQVWMTRVDSSGRVGIVLEDGMVAARHGEE